MSNVVDLVTQRTKQLLAEENIEAIIARLSEEAWHILERMEQSGGEPAIARIDGRWAAVDCSDESPIGRRACCYDEAARLARKKNAPLTSAESLAEQIGITLLTEAQYRQLQAVKPIDRKTSSWLQTPAPIREKGGALFGDNRYETVFCYHNGADSYYSARGFRGLYWIE